MKGWKERNILNLNSRKEARPGRDGSFLPEKQRAGAEQFL
jgi:hypothetical protein